MALYKVKYMSIKIGGKNYRQSDGHVFDTFGADSILLPEIQAAAKAGFLEEIGKPIEVIEEKPELKKAKKKNVTD